jgi:hypothetical protein
MLGFYPSVCAWWCRPETPALRRLQQEDWEFEASLGYIMTRPSLKIKKKKNRASVTVLPISPHNRVSQLVYSRFKKVL